jgi:hypothetical protein
MGSNMRSGRFAFGTAVESEPHRERPVGDKESAGQLVL